MKVKIRIETSLLQYGYSPDDYSEQTDYNFLDEERTKEYGSETYLMERYLIMRDSIKESDMERLKEYRESLKIGKHTLNDIDTKVGQSYMQSKYRPLLFVCVDHNRIDMAKYLMEEGSSVRVYAPVSTLT